MWAAAALGRALRGTINNSTRGPFQAVNHAGIRHSACLRMFIQTRDTPNPNSLKFLPGVKVLEEGQSRDFPSIGSAKDSLLVRQLFAIPGVERVFLGPDFITVTRADDALEWTALKASIYATMMDFFSAGLPVLESPESVKEVENKLDKVEFDEEHRQTVAMISELIETRIRPTVMEDGGDIVFHAFRDGVVELELQGSCTGCPSSSVTLKAGIENMLMFYVPEVKSVKEVLSKVDEIAQREFEKLEEKIRTKPQE
ncbi:NFU1 iron-sulfur cluster [Tropilaelaps mercedesae]|uniref:NFU1 iron-sulfur cluster scaffold homolog, mitochondrial n=1 Tax=Tropilaelaps mercedesae TaxID=418985 RepID=A0A1V9XTD1_9ACAR|nr:NFU1 iron-sulfur cluster [Tropilaelaps mercedesae]